MNRVWTPAEDQKLKQGIAKHGFKWQKIKDFMNNTRSVNSLVKRWHYKVKYYDIAIVPKTENASIKEQELAEQKGQDEEIEQPISNSSDKPLNKVQYQWKKMWTDHQDKKLKLFVIESGILNWSQLSKNFETTVQEIQMRWRNFVYPTITKRGFKVGGSLKWSFSQDKILNFGYKQEISWEYQGRFFLPIRTLGSIEARWRRVYKNFEVKQTFENRHLQLRQCLRKIAKKQRQGRERQNKES